MKTNQSFVRVLFATVGRAVGFLFGQISWAAPPWLAWIYQRLKGGFCGLKSPLRVGALVATAALAFGAWQSWGWWQSHRARQFSQQVVRNVEVRVSQKPVAVMPGKLNMDLEISPLRISFVGAPAAPLGKIGKDAGEVVTLDPPLLGKWTWLDGSTLEFRPEQAWSPGAKLTARLRPTALAKNLKLANDSLEINAPPLVAEWKDFSFYNSPKDPSVYQVVAELLLSHSVALEVLEKKIQLEVVGGTRVFTDGSPAFTVTADPLSARRFFIRSRQIVVPAKEDWVKLTLPAGVSSTLAGTGLAQNLEAKTRIPDKFSGLQIANAETKIIRTDEGEPQQFLFVSTNLDIDSAEVARHIHLWWRADGWSDDKGNLVFKDRVATAKQVALVPVENEVAYSKEHAFRFVQTQTDGEMLLHIDPSVKSPGGFETNTLFEKPLSVLEFPKETKLLGKGNILALDGERKLVVESRGVDHFRVTLGRVPTSQLQHLISLAGSSRFANPSFEDMQFSQDNLIQRWSKIVAVKHQNASQAVQSVIDLTESPPLMTPAAEPGGCGVFFVTVEPVKPNEEEAVEDDVYAKIESADDATDEEPGKYYWYENENFKANDGWQSAEGIVSKRFIMATDLGLLVKAGADGSRDVYVMALGAGQPVAEVELQALARNGSVLEKAVTDSNGHARLSALKDFTGDRLPIAVLASKGGDTSFLPFNERQLPAMDYSHFDIEGVLASRIKAIEAFVFTERGVYRPGDVVHAGFITRRRDWQPVLEGLPLAISISDSAGHEVASEQTRLAFDGFFVGDFELPENAALGLYEVTVNVQNAEGEPLFRLGRVAVRVEEFQPDRMKVATALDPIPPSGWLDCKVTDAKVTVQSLFGEAAPDRRVTMQLDLSPADFGFPEWPGFTFYDRVADESKSRAGRTIELGEIQTDAQGIATFKLPLDTLKDASFRLAILSEAFEREGGRSVRSATTCLVSPNESIVGWKADGDLQTIAKDSGRSLSLVAVARDLKPLALENRRRRVIEIRQVSVLTKLDSGSYAYVSTAKERVISEEAFNLTAGAAEYPIPTDRVGQFRLEIIDAESVVHCAVPFQVVGKGDESATLEREAELQLRLSKSEVLPGEEIEVFLAAPYSGAGLVSIEREKVITSQWFKTETKGTSVRLKIPADAEGTYYINAAFVRGTSAPEIFHSPLSYAAAPVRVLAPQKKLALQLEAPQEVRPGTEVRLGIRADRPARVVIYAVDEGIHQITAYKLPQPLDFFLRKQALEVRTQQWLDLLLPEYRFLKTTAFGGDGDEDMALSLHLNPFKRRQEAPVVFWSGMVEAGPERKEVTWKVPDYFNGNLRVMAVACQAGGIGTAEASTLVKAPIILQPTAPLFVAPGDEFEVSLSVFNHLAVTGVTQIQLKVTPSDQLELLGESMATLPLESGKEGIARFRCRAKDQLSGAELRFEASGGGEVVSRSSTLSVRPATHLLTQVVTGWFRTGSVEEKVKRTLYQEKRRVEATASVVPLSLARGLEAYVKEYPYGCTEQITSRAMVKLIAATEADFGLSQKDAADAVRSAISQLAARQRADGSFGYWSAAASSSDEFHSLYALHFLTEAKLLGHAIPEDLMQGAMKYATQLARESTTSLANAELQAYAIYLLASNGTNPSPQLLNLRDTLTAKHNGKWEASTAAAWMAASYQLLKQETEANKLLDICLKARATPRAKNSEMQFYQRAPMIEEIEIFYLQCRHFPERAKRFGIEALEPIMKPLRDQSFNTLACGYMTLALKAYSDVARSTGMELSILGIARETTEPKVLAGPAQGILRADLGMDLSAIRFDRKPQAGSDLGVFYQVVEQGYDAAKATAPLSEGLEISREITPLHQGEPLRPGDPVDVVLRVRNVSGKNLASLAVVDLLPAGFEVSTDSLKSGASTVPGADFTELREDRTLFFLGLAANAEWSVKYRMKAQCVGAFAVPSALVEDMYDRGLHGVSKLGRIEIAAAK